MKKRNVMRLAVYTMVLVCTLFLWAGSARAEEKKPEIKSVEYQGNEKVEVEFSGKVSWKKAKVTVTDTEGTVYKTKILEKDRNEIEVKVKALTAGKTYTYTITGIARKGTKKYQTLNGTFVA